jgi:hypothetical protein
MDVMVAHRRALCLCLIPVALALLPVAAGCGNEEANPNDDPAVESPERPDEAPDADPAEGNEELGGAARRALEACRQVVERTPGIPEETKREVIADCEAAARGDEEARRKAARAACDVVAAATAPPLLRGQVADVCKRAISGAALRT